MIHAQALRKQFSDGDRQLVVLDGVTLEVGKGEFVTVLGPSGSGKSTLLHLLGGLDVHYQGTLRVAGVPLTGLSDAALSDFRNEQVGLVFQSFHLVPQLSAMDNVGLPAFFRRRGPPTPVQVRARARTLLQKVGLGDKLERRPAQLSGGERQRVAIARALFFAPPVLLCDEPTGNLDAQTGAEIISLFRALHADGLTVLAMTHEERLSNVAQRTLRLSQGKLFEVPPLSTNPQ